MHEYGHASWVTIEWEFVDWDNQNWYPEIKVIVRTNEIKENSTYVTELRANH